MNFDRIFTAGIAAWLALRAIANNTKNHPKYSSKLHHESAAQDKSADPIWAINQTLVSFVDQQDSNKKQTDCRSRRNNAIGSATLVVLVIYTAFTIALWCAQRQANITNARSLIEANRAWIGALQPTFESAYWLVPLHDFGRNPGLDIHFSPKEPVITDPPSKMVGADWHALGVWLDPSLAKESICSGVDPQRDELVIYPIDDLKYYRKPVHLAAPNTLADVISGAKFPVLTGCIAYRTMGSVHRTSYCFYLQPVLEAENWKMGQQWFNCPVGNSAD